MKVKCDECGLERDNHGGRHNICFQCGNQLYWKLQARFKELSLEMISLLNEWDVYYTISRSSIDIVKHYFFMEFEKDILNQLKKTRKKLNRLYAISEKYNFHILK